jgi:hypothetical protein
MRGHKAILSESLDDRCATCLHLVLNQCIGREAAELRVMLIKAA